MNWLPFLLLPRTVSTAACRGRAARLYLGGKKMRLRRAPQPPSGILLNLSRQRNTNFEEGGGRNPPSGGL